MLKINILGDSISKGLCASSEENSYVRILSKLLNAKINNYSVSGTRIAKQTHPTTSNPSFDLSFQDRAKEMKKDVDLVFVFGGSNDFGHGDVPIKTDNQYDEYSFAGGLNNLYTYLIKEYGKNKVKIILPLHRYDENCIFGQCHTGVIQKKKHSPILKEYVDVIKEVALKYDLEVIDISDEFGYPTSFQNEGLYFDGLHPNDEGHKKLANLLANKISAILKRK